MRLVVLVPGAVVGLLVDLLRVLGEHVAHGVGKLLQVAVWHERTSLGFPSPGSGARDLLMLASPLVDLALGGFTGDAVALLDNADQLVAAALHPHHVVVSQLAPLLLHVALELVPVSADGIPVEMHLYLLPVDDTLRP